MNQLPDPEIVASRPRNRRWTIAGLVLIFTIFPVVAFFWMYPAWKYQQAFEVPKITIAHLDGEPFMRMKLRPGESYRPLELMEKTRVMVECEVVSKGTGMRFRINAFGVEEAGKDCVFDLEVPADVGAHETVVFQFFDGDAAEPTDELEVPVAIVSRGERLEFHGLEDSEGHTVQAGAVPEKVVVYARAIVNEIPDYKDLVPLFFVADTLTGVPVLQLKPTTEEGEEPSPLTGQFVRYRNYGEKIRGYALWSRDHLTIGGDRDHRRVFDIYYGFFPEAEIDEVFRKTLSVEWTGEDSVKVIPLVKNVKKLRKMTYQGRFLSPPLHVVRGAVSVGVGGAIGSED